MVKNLSFYYPNEIDLFPPIPWSVKFHFVRIISFSPST